MGVGIRCVSVVSARPTRVGERVWVWESDVRQLCHSGLLCGNQTCVSDVIQVYRGGIRRVSDMSVKHIVWVSDVCQSGLLWGNEIYIS